MGSQVWKESWHLWQQFLDFAADCMKDILENGSHKRPPYQAEFLLRSSVNASCSNMHHFVAHSGFSVLRYRASMKNSSTSADLFFYYWSTWVTSVCANSSVYTTDLLFPKKHPQRRSCLFPDERSHEAAVPCQERPIYNPLNLPLGPGTRSGLGFRGKIQDQMEHDLFENTRKNIWWNSAPSWIWICCAHTHIYSMLYRTILLHSLSWISKIPASSKWPRLGWKAHPILALQAARDGWLVWLDQTWGSKEFLFQFIWFGCLVDFIS